MENEKRTAFAEQERRHHKMMLAQQSAYRLICVLDRFIPSAVRREAQDALAELFFMEGVELTTIEMRRQYEQWRTIYSESVAALARLHPMANLRSGTDALSMETEPDGQQTPHAQPDARERQAPAQSGAHHEEAPRQDRIERGSDAEGEPGSGNDAGGFRSPSPGYAWGGERSKSECSDPSPVDGKR